MKKIICAVSALMVSAVVVIGLCSFTSRTEVKSDVCTEVSCQGKHCNGTVGCDCPGIFFFLRPEIVPTTGTHNGTHNGHEWVDLGLSVKWATCNVGASAPSDYGNYYAWGEVRTKSTYWDFNCTTWEKSMGDIAGDPAYDAARYNWGGRWRLPTKAECQELVDNCTWTWTEQGGHKGYRVTSKKNGASIFLPAAGYRTTDWPFPLSDGESGIYYSSTPYESDALHAYYLTFCSNYYGNYYGMDWFIDRAHGHSVRPVLEAYEYTQNPQKEAPLGIEYLLSKKAQKVLACLGNQQPANILFTTSRGDDEENRVTRIYYVKKCL